MDKKSARHLDVTIDGFTTKVILFAKRGEVLFGICRTVEQSVLLLKIVEGPGEAAFPNLQVLSTSRVTTWGEYLYKKNNDGGRMLDNNLRVPTSCFLSNNQLKQQFPDLEDELVELTKKMFEEIPKAVRYDTTEK